ncbi:MAG: hypothetical protein II070_10555, partial [Treponema sp.]|nr:hypothetical protein [Treponema sp.]
KEDFIHILGAFRTSAIAPFSLCENACGGAPIPAALAFATHRHATPRRHLQVSRHSIGTS